MAAGRPLEALLYARGVTFALPGFADPAQDERELLLSFVRVQRGDVVRTADGLDEEQLRWTPPGGLVPIIGTINHLTHMEWRWMNGRYLRSPFPARVDEWTVEPGRTGHDVIAAYHAQAQRTEEAVRGATSLDEPCLGREGDGPTLHDAFGQSTPITLRWALLHLIEETAHHAGHLDGTRQLLDGSTAAQLLERVRSRQPGRRP